MSQRWAETAEPNRSVPLLPPAYVECFRCALRRLAVAVNCRRSQHCPPTLLASTDDEIARHFASNRLDAQLYSLSYEEPDRNLDDEDVVEHFFYGWFNFRPKPKTNTIRCDYSLTDAFLDYSYKGLERPDYTDEQLGKGDMDPTQLAAACATNYILKNFWHNYAHNELQGITQANYHEFAGEGRYDSDFDADGLATILLAKSYGLPVTSSATGFQPNQRIVVLLRRNRCNKVFGLRSGKRKPDPKAGGPAALLEDEWRFRRTLAGYISGWLLAAGRAVPQVRVHLRGELQRSRSGYRRRPGLIVAEVNGLRLATEMPVPKLEGKGLREYMRQVAGVVDAEYAHRLSESKALRKYSVDVMKARLKQVGIEP